MNGAHVDKKTAGYGKGVIHPASYRTPSKVEELTEFDGHGKHCTLSPPKFTVVLNPFWQTQL